MNAPPQGAGLVVIHGHFYQPPRENPWTGEVDAEPSAAPDHDWNVRVTRETYEPLVSVEVEDGGQKTQVAAYEYLSFDFGPTLLDWMERESPAIHAAVIRADRASVNRLGHGNALAMPYHHIILPLASRRDKETEVRWGIADFKRRFGRDPVGFWLPETAVDRESLDVLAAAGMKFTVLAPHQVSRVPAQGRPAKIDLDAGRSIAVFPYDGGLSHEIAFGGLQTDPNRWTEALNGTPAGAVASIAVDGETFGHHHKGGDKALATVIHRLRNSDKVRLGNFAAALAQYPATETVDLAAPSSWSCSHGVERWRSACGCKIEQNAPTQQDWRAPLRAAIDWLAGEVHALYERDGADLPGGPWAFRDEAGATGQVSGGQEAERLIEMERGVLRAMTSCGWFFDDIAGIEARQVLRYAAYTISLAGPEAGRLEAGFVEKLGEARSNDPKAGTAADVFRQTAQPTPS
jgi:alpha-amylase/alpha-mannosidase (GH57 family)